MKQSIFKNKINLLPSDPRWAEGRHRIISKRGKGVVCSVNQMSCAGAGRGEGFQQSRGRQVQEEVRLSVGSSDQPGPAWLMHGCKISKERLSREKWAFSRNCAESGQTGLCCWAWHGWYLFLLSLEESSLNGHVKKSQGRKGINRDRGLLEKNKNKEETIIIVQTLISGQTEKKMFCAIHLLE